MKITHILQHTQEVRWGLKMKQCRTTYKLKYTSSQKWDELTDVTKHSHSHPEIHSEPEVRWPQVQRSITFTFYSTQWAKARWLHRKHSHILSAAHIEPEVRRLHRCKNTKPPTSWITYEIKSKSELGTQIQTCIPPSASHINTEVRQAHKCRNTATYALQHMSIQKWDGLTEAEMQSHSQAEAYTRQEVR